VFIKTPCLCRCLKTIGVVVVIPNLVLFILFTTETGSKGYTHPILQYPSGWIEGSLTDAGGNSYPMVQPTAGSQGGSQPGHKTGQPETPSLAAVSQGDSRHNSKSRQHTAPTLAAGL
jgi:hypothetical protein